MTFQSAFHKNIYNKRGTFEGSNFLISTDSVNWLHVKSLSITELGQLFSTDEQENHYLLLQALQSCYVQICPNSQSLNTQRQQQQPQLVHLHLQQLLSTSTLSGRESSTSRRRSRGLGSRKNTNNNKLSSDGNASNNTSNPPEEDPPIIFIKTFENDKLYIKVASKANFGNLISTLIVWQNLKPQGLAKKWYSENKVTNQKSSSSSSPLDGDISSSPHELLVCRFKIYGPLPNKSKNLNIIPGPVAPIYQPKIDDHLYNKWGSENHAQSPHADYNRNNNINEGWFYTMGALNSNGILNFITELDGTLLYSIDIKKIFASEIREVHNSIFNSSNVLFIGQLNELRYNNVIRTTSATSNAAASSTSGASLSSSSSASTLGGVGGGVGGGSIGGGGGGVGGSIVGGGGGGGVIGGFGSASMAADPLSSIFLTRDGKIIPSNNRIFIEFPLHIDLEDWFVGLNYFAKREYIGSFNNEARLLTSDKKKGGINAGAGTGKEEEYMPPPRISDFSKANFRVSKKVTIDIIEAKFDHSSLAAATKSGSTAMGGGKIYAEVRMWGYPWSRTAIVNHTLNPFWKEEFLTNLPISTQMIHIIIKKCAYNDGTSYSANDKVIGTVYVTPDILTKHIKTSSTIMTAHESNGIQVNNSIPLANSSLNNGLNNGLNSALTNNGASTLDIVRLTIYDPSNIPIGKLLLQVNLKEFHILSSPNFKSLEFLLKNGPIDQLVNFFNENVAASEFERISVILLDIFQCLHQEERFFKTLMEMSLSSLGNKLATQSKSTSQNNVFNTLFRGSSIFSKALERYNIRIGQEYLEKVFGDFFAKINKECKNCEVDPRYVKIQERAARKGLLNKDNDLTDLDDLCGSSDDDDDDDGDGNGNGYDSEMGREKEERIKRMVEDNYQNLYGYAEEIWHKIYITSNDIPEQIKLQLKNFRTKVELVCEPNDKVTSLNCISAFIFLRFFCPAILNPKLFYLTKNHQTGSTQRTLTLIAKILLNLANRQEFSPHKEPHLVKMNSFLRKHQSEVYDYFDKITGRKNDFNEKILDLSHEVKRFDLGLDETSNELPTTPYLIDKYLRLTELVHLLNYNTVAAQKILNESANASQMGTPFASPLKNIEPTSTKTNHTVSSVSSHAHSQLSELDPIKFGDADDNVGGVGGEGGEGGYGEVDFHLGNLSALPPPNENVYQIGSLEFEKLEFLDLAGDKETEGFIKSLCNGNEEIFSFININISLKDIQMQSTKIMNKINDLETYLENYEFPSNYTSSKTVGDLLWGTFTDDVLDRACLDLTRNVIVSLDYNPVSLFGGGGGGNGGTNSGSNSGGNGASGDSSLHRNHHYHHHHHYGNPNYKFIVDDNALTLLKLKFPENSGTGYGVGHRQTASISSLTLSSKASGRSGRGVGMARSDDSSTNFNNGSNGLDRMRDTLKKWLGRGR